MTTDPRAQASPGYRITRVKVRVFKSPDPMPAWRETMLLAKPHRKLLNRWVWEVNRNHHFLTTEERAQYARGEMLLIAVPDVMKDMDADELGEMLVPERVR